MAGEETVTEVVQKEEAPLQVSEVEQRALSSGWLPKDKWEGEPEEWVPARQFVKNGELFGRINSYKNKIIGLEKTVTELVKHNEKVWDSGYTTAVAELKKERTAALREGDTERVLEIEEQAETLQAEYQTRKQEFDASVKAPAPQSNPMFDQWVSDNPWYETDVALHGYADGEARSLVEATQRMGKQVEYDKLLREVGRKVRDKFPEKFNGGGITQRPASATNKGDETSQAGRRTVGTKYQLNPMEEEIFKTLEKSGLTREKYVDDLIKVKQRKGG